MKQQPVDGFRTGKMYKKKKHYRKKRRKCFFLSEIYTFSHSVYKKEYKLKSLNKSKGLKFCFVSVRRLRSMTRPKNKRDCVLSEVRRIGEIQGITHETETQSIIVYNSFDIT